MKKTKKPKIYRVYLGGKALPNWFDEDELMRIARDMAIHYTRKGKKNQTTVIRMRRMHEKRIQASQKDGCKDQGGD